MSQETENILEQEFPVVGQEAVAQDAPKERKNRFQVSREVQEEFVNNMAEKMLTMMDSAGKWKRGWTENEAPLGMPFCPATGKEYSGSNMATLMLTSMMAGFDDDRWLTYKQMDAIREKNPDLKMHIRKGAKGTKILRPEQVDFIIEEDGNWKFLNKKELKEIQEMKERGEEVPKVNHKMLFYPFTVFNASQIEGFPPKEHIAPAMSPIERNELVEQFIASSGVAVDHYDGGPCFVQGANVVKLPHPESFTGTDEYYAAKLHEFFHATGHESRENRLKPNSDTQAYAFEEMRAEMFSMMAGAHLGLPMPEINSAAYIKHWNQKFSGGDAKDVFRATGEAAKMLTLLHQYQVGEKPAPAWFPKQEEWPALIQMQKDRDAACGATFKGEPSVQPEPGEKIPRPEPAPYEQLVVNFKDASEPAEQIRIILQNPKFLDEVRKLEPEKAHDLASLMSTVSMGISMEADEKQREQRESAPQAAPSAPAMRMR